MEKAHSQGGSCYTLALIEAGDAWADIPWEKHDALVSADAARKLLATSKPDYELKNNLKLSADEIDVFDLDVTSGEVIACFEKIGVQVAEKVDFSAGGATHKYVWDIFGPGATKAQQKWWIENCAGCGAPDDMKGHKQLHLLSDSAADIVEYLG